MKKAPAALAVLAFTLALSARPSDGYASFATLADPLSTPGRVTLLLVAVDDYAAHPALPGAEAGAGALRAALARAYFIDEVVELYGERARKVAIVRELERLASTLGPQDSLVVYLGGRGGPEDRAGYGYFLAQDALEGGEEKVGWIGYSWIASLFERAALKHFLLIADAFASDSWFLPEAKAPSIDPRLIASAFASRSRQFLLAASDPSFPPAAFRGEDPPVPASFPSPNDPAPAADVPATPADEAPRDGDGTLGSEPPGGDGDSPGLLPLGEEPALPEPAPAPFADHSSIALRVATFLENSPGDTLEVRALAQALGMLDALCVHSLSRAASPGSMVFVPRSEAARAAFALALSRPAFDPKPSLARTGYILVAGSEAGIVSVDGVALRPVEADTYLQIELAPGVHKVEFSGEFTVLRKEVTVEEGMGAEVLFIFPAKPGSGAAVAPPAGGAESGSPGAGSSAAKPKTEGVLPESLRKYSAYAEKLIATLKPGDRVRATKDYGRISKGSLGTFMGIAKIGYPDCCIKWDGLTGATPMAEALPDGVKIADRQGIYFVEWDGIEKFVKK